MGVGVIFFVVLEIPGVRECMHADGNYIFIIVWAR